MPVKAKPVEYVKICSLYGTGFYYIPGTDTCLKIGGFVRVQVEHNSSDGTTVGSGGKLIGSGRFDRADTNDVNFRVRAVTAFDARTQTEYGTLRSYIRAGWDQTTPSVSGAGTTPCSATTSGACLGWWDRAFIQFAGFTIGRAQSFFDLFNFGGTYSYTKPRTTGDTNFDGEDLWAYTVQFGNGVSYTLSLEDPIAHYKAGTIDISAPGFFAFPVATATDNAFNNQSANNNGFRVPDIVTNLRIDQAWGYAGISTAIHDVSGAYYQTPDNVNNGHPSDKYGYAVGVGGLINLPGGDIIGANYVWSEGAIGYAQQGGNWQQYHNSNRIAAVWQVDGVFGTGGDVQLTRAWSINAAYQHIWGPAGTWGGKWRTSIYGGYVAVHYNEAATQLINSQLPAGNGCGAGAGGNFVGWTPLAGNSCSPNYSFYQIGTRTQFNPAPLMDIGLDLWYTRLNTAYSGPVNWVANSARPACTNSAIISCAAEDFGVVSAVVRWQRNFYP